MKLSEGYDCPSIDTVINLRATKSDVLFRQIIGRGIRKSEETGKTHMTVLNFFDGCENIIQPTELFRNNHEWDNEVMRISNNLVIYYEGEDKKEVSLYKCKKEARALKKMAKYLGYKENMGGLSSDELYIKLFDLEAKRIGFYQYKSPFFKELQENVKKEILMNGIYDEELEKGKTNLTSDDFSVSKIELQDILETKSKFEKINQVIINEEIKLSKKYDINISEIKDIKEHDSIIEKRNREFQYSLKSPRLITKKSIMDIFPSPENGLNEEIKNLKIYTFKGCDELASFTDKEILKQLGFNINGYLYKEPANRLLIKINDAFKKEGFTISSYIDVMNQYNFNINQGLKIWEASIHQNNIKNAKTKLNWMNSMYEEYSTVMNSFLSNEKDSIPMNATLKYACQDTHWEYDNCNLIYRNGISIEIPKDFSNKQALLKLNKFSENLKNVMKKYNAEINNSEKEFKKIVRDSKPQQSILSSKIKF